MLSKRWPENIRKFELKEELKISVSFERVEEMVEYDRMFVPGYKIEVSEEKEKKFIDKNNKLGSKIENVVTQIEYIDTDSHIYTSWLRPNPDNLQVFNELYQESFLPKAVEKMLEMYDGNALKTILQQMSKSDNEYNKYQVRLLKKEFASNSKTLIEVIQLLAQEPDLIIIGIVAEREDLPDSILLKFAKNPHDYIKNIIAIKTNLPEHILLILLQDCTESVKDIIRQKINDLSEKDWLVLFENMKKYGYQYERLLIEYRDNLPESFLLAYLKDDWISDIVKEKILEKEDLPESVLIILACDALKDIRSILANKNNWPNLPERVLLILAQDEESDIKWLIAERDNLPQSVVDILMNDPDEYVRAAYLRYSSPEWKAKNKEKSKA